MSPAIGPVLVLPPPGQESPLALDGPAPAAIARCTPYCPAGVVMVMAGRASSYRAIGLRY